GDRGHTEPLPQRCPEHALVADVAFQNHQHLAEGFGQHVDVSNGGFFTVSRGQNRVQHFECAHAVFGGGGVRQFIERSLLGGKHHGFNVSKREAFLLTHVQDEFFQFV